jgi:hypothetical protein
MRRLANVFALGYRCKEYGFTDAPSCQRACSPFQYDPLRL